MTSQFTDQDLASMSGPRTMKEPGSVDWCWQTVSALQHMWQSLHLNYEHYITILNEAEDEAIWEKIPQGQPYGSKAKMLAQVEVGDSKDVRKRMRMQTLAAQAKALQKQGRPANGTSGDENVYSDSLKPKGGADPKYLLQRIARDRPDILQRVTDGEFTSALAAARAAGIPLAQPKKTVTLGDNVERVADTIKAHYSDEQIQRIVSCLTDSADDVAVSLSEQ